MKREVIERVYCLIKIFSCNIEARPSDLTRYNEPRPSGDASRKLSKNKNNETEIWKYRISRGGGEEGRREPSVTLHIRISLT